MSDSREGKNEPQDRLLEASLKKAREYLADASQNHGSAMASMGMIIAGTEGLASALGPKAVANLLSILARRWSAGVEEREPSSADLTEH